MAEENARLRTQVRQMDWMVRESVQAIEQRRHQVHLNLIPQSSLSYRSQLCRTTLLR